MADEQEWSGFADQGYIAASNTLLARTSVGAGVEVAGTHVVARRTATGTFHADGQLEVSGSISVGAAPSGSGLIEVTGTGAALVIIKGAAGAAFYINKAGGGTFAAMGDRATILGGAVESTFSIYTGSAPLHFDVGGGSRMVIDPTGTVRPGGDNSQSLGTASFRWSTIYAGTGSINTSDERAKDEIGDIPDAWLDAWGDVAWSRFKFKGGRRWHVGLIAQRVHAAFAAHGLDAFDIGLCCFDEWDAETRDIVDDDGAPTGKQEDIAPAGDRWGLRYDECFAMEAAWVRREMVRMAAR